MHQNMPVNMLTMQHSKVSSCCAVNLIVSSADIVVAFSVRLILKDLAGVAEFLPHIIMNGNDELSGSILVLQLYI